MKLKISEAEGEVLDRLVAYCEGIRIVGFKQGRATFIDPADDGALNETLINYSTDWAQAGPIIENWEIGIKRNAPCSYGRQWEASPSIRAKGAGWKFGYGSTPLIAAMRCYVVSKLGDEVEVPDEIVS
jgi:hypothetical protein